MKHDPITHEVGIETVRRISKVVGPSSAATEALKWQALVDEPCRFFYTSRRVLVAVTESFLTDVGPLKNVELERHFTVIPDSQYVQCLHCGKSRINNQGLAKLAHLAKCTGARKTAKSLK